MKNSHTCEIGPGIVKQPCPVDDSRILGVPNLILVERGQQNIPICCDVCIEEVSEVWLTFTCPIQLNINQFPNETRTIEWQDENGETLEAVDGTLLVQRPGTYTCKVTFSGLNLTDSASSTVSCK